MNIPVNMSVKSITAIVNFLIDHKDDIKNSVNDFGELKPVYEQFICKSKEGE